MNKNNTETKERPELLEELQALLEKSRGAFKQERTYRRALGLMVGELLTLGRHTMTQILRSLGAVEQDWSAWYRMFSEQRYEEDELGGIMLQESLEHVGEKEAYVVTVDGVIIPRTGKQVGGSSWWRGQKTAAFRRGLQRGQRFVEVAWLTPDEKSYCRAIPLRWIAAVTEKAVESEAKPKKEWEAGLELVKWVREELDRRGRQAQVLVVVVVDGNYDVQGIWKDLPHDTTVVVRTARNRKLFRMAVRKERRGPGRPAVYGERYPTPAEFLQQRKRKHWTALQLNIRGRQRNLQYRVEGPCLLEDISKCPLMLVVVRGKSYTYGKRRKRKRYRKPYFMLVNAVWREGKWQLPFSVQQLLTWAWQRWECEVSHREMKSALGIGEKQCWSSRAALTSVQWGGMVYGVCVLAAYRTWGITQGPRRAGRWYRHARRWSFASMWQAYRAALWETGNFSPLYAPSLANWLKTDLWLTGLGNALADPGRI